MRKIILLIFLFLLFITLELFADTSLFNNKFDGNYTQLFLNLKLMAEKGDGISQANLAVLYENGLGTIPDYNKAIYWNQQAIKNNVKFAYNNLASIYKRGLGVKKDYTKAFKLYEKAADYGYIRADYNLSLMYYDGTGVKKDYKKAEQLMNKAAQANEPMAQTALSTQYYQGTYGTQQDYSKALYWAKKAAEQGYSPAQQWLAVLYYQGKKPIPKDLILAFKWDYIAARNGGTQGANNIKYLAKQMSKSDIAKAKQQGEEWLKTHKNINTDLISAGTFNSQGPNKSGTVEIHLNH